MSSRSAALACAALVTTLACSSRDTAVTAVPPAPDAAVLRACEQLAQRLPASIGKALSRRHTKPDSPLIAAWGSPPVILRCGVPIDPGFKPGEQTIEIQRDGAKVNWYAVKRGDRVVWSTPLATVHVEVAVPLKYQGADVIGHLTTAVSTARLL
ncbi:MAG: DUF3515 family protein [Actinomycetota bacterium]